MSQKSNRRRDLPAAAHVFGDLQATDALAPSGVSALRKASAVFLALLVLGATPLFFAAFAAGVIGDAPTAIAHSNSGPGSDDDSSGPGSGDDDDDDTTTVKTDDTSANDASTRGTTDDNDTATKLGTDDTSANANSTNGTTNDNDTITAGATGADTGQTNTSS
jgi:hypothetical protein